MPRVLPRPAAELNATQEKRQNEKNREDADANFTSPRRKYCAAQNRLRDHSPKNKKTEPRFNIFEQFVFETVFRLIAPCHSNSRVKGQELRIAIGGLDYRVTLSTTVCTALLVPFT